MVKIRSVIDEILIMLLLLLFMLFLIPQTYLLSFVKIGSGTAEILMTLSLCSGVWWFKVIFMSSPTFELSWSWVGVVTTTNKRKNNKRIVSTASNTSNSEGILYTDADSAHYPFFSSFNFALLQNFRIITRFTSTVLCTWFCSCFSIFLHKIGQNVTHKKAFHFKLRTSSLYI